MEDNKKFKESAYPILRQRLFGYEMKHDDSRDDEVDELSSDEAMTEILGWHLGYSSWWDSIKSYMDLVNLEVKEKRKPYNKGVLKELLETPITLNLERGIGDTSKN